MTKKEFHYLKQLGVESHWLTKCSNSDNYDNSLHALIEVCNKMNNAGDWISSSGYLL